MKNSLFRLEIAPLLGMFVLLIGTTTVGDALLERLGYLWIGRYLGIPGTLLIILSLTYSLRKRKYISSGNPQKLLRMHELLTWLGALLVLVHAGHHFNTILPWLALIAMVVNLISGMIGRYLLARSRQHMMAKQESYKTRGLSKVEIDKELFWDAVTFQLMEKWRVVHFPISFIFAILTLGHIISILMFWEWR
ncbi:MAG: hypothetical protein L3J67_04320 [Hyphomicrobiaceae bacterium]|nr:hypothetical protein [Hyphomicrobiaceae bacterium]